MANREIIKELFVLLGVETDGDDFKKAEQALDDIVAVAKKVVFGIAAVSTAIVVSTVSAARYGDQAAKTARQVGLTAEEVQVLTFAAERGGATFEQFRTGMAKVQQRAAEAARGNKEYRKEFQRLGIDVKDSSGKLKGGLDLLSETAVALSKIPSAGERARVAMKLFEEGGIQLLPFLTKMAGDLPELTKRFELLGAGISNEAAANAELAADAMLDLRLASTGVIRRLGTGLVPTLALVANKTVDWFIANRQLIDRGIAKVVDISKVAVAKVGAWIQTISRGIEMVGGFKNILIATAAVLSLGFATSIGAAAFQITKLVLLLGTAQKAIILTKLVALGEFALIGIAIAAVFLIAEDFITFLQGGESIIGDFLNAEAIDGEPRLFTFLRDLLDLVRTLLQVWDNTFGLLTDTKWDDAKDFWSTFWDDILENWQTKIPKLLNLLNPLNVLDPFGVTDTVSSAAGGVLGGAVEAAAGFIPENFVPGPASGGVGSLTFSSPTSITIDGAGDSADEVASKTAQAVEERNAEALRAAQRELER